MKNPFRKTAQAESGKKAFFVTITPPEGSTWVGVQKASSEEEIRQNFMKQTGRTKQEIAGRVSAVLLRPPAGMDYRETPFMITRKSKDEVLKSLLGSAF